MLKRIEEERKYRGEIRRKLNKQDLMKIKHNEV